MNEDIVKGCTVRRSKKAAWRVFGEQGVVLNTESSKIAGINKTGAALWEILDEDHQLDDVISLFAQKFQKSSSEVEDDVVQFIRCLQDRGLVEIVCPT